MGKFVGVRVGGMDYGVPIAQVNSLDRVTTVHKIPKSSAHVKGFVEYRDRIVTALDLGVMLGVGEVSDTFETRIMYVNTSESETVGVFVDEAIGVFEVREDQLTSGRSLDVDLLAGIQVAHLESGLLLLVDVVELLANLDTKIAS